MFGMRAQHGCTISIANSQRQSRDRPTDQSRRQTEGTEHSDTDSTKAVGNLPERCVTECRVTSNNLTEPQTNVARHSQNTVIPESTQIWFPFDHSLTSSTEVLAKRLIGTCA